jgi:HSP20 family protein
MFPWKRRRRDFEGEDDFFKDLDEEFREMEEHITKMFNELGRMSIEEPGESGPYIYGFSLRTGPEGEPRIEEFGNIPHINPEETGIPEDREPFTDVIEGEKEISVILELPGIEKKDIDLNITKNSLGINVETPERKYLKKLNLPCEVKPKKAKATFKNGVLEVKIERVEKKQKRKSVKIKIN